MRLPVARDPVGEQRGFAGTGFSEDDQWLGVVGGGVRVEPVEVFLSADVNALATLGIGFVIHRLAVERGGLRAFREKFVDDPREVG